MLGAPSQSPENILNQSGMRMPKHTSTPWLVLPWFMNGFWTSTERFYQVLAPINNC